MHNESFPLGSRWHPYLSPVGVQLCTVCKCTIEFQPNAACYVPKINFTKLQLGDEPSLCPKVPKRCPDGAPPTPMKNHPCCLACGQPNRVLHWYNQLNRLEEALGDAYEPSYDMVATADQLSEEELTRQGPQQKSKLIANGDAYFDLVTKNESFWLFKEIARGHGEVISAVKPVPFCNSV